VERELLPMAAALDLAVTAWAPLGGGLLTGRYGTDRARPTDTRLAGIGGDFEKEAASDRKLRIADAVNAVAASRGASATQVALAWLLSRQDRSVVIPILGVRTPEQLEDNLACLDLRLEEEDLTALDAAGSVPASFPDGFAGSDMAYGELLPRIVDHRRAARGRRTLSGW
jgi:aryl-alcohol dehydrogenase-like predicted oxidoreductase